MKFEYQNPIKFYFGNDVFKKIPDLCKGKKVLLVYGGGSIKKIGVYDQITTLLKNANIQFVEYGNQTKATYQGILDGIDLAKREQVEAVIEIGGASAMDTGKAIAFGAVHDNLEEFIQGKREEESKHLLNIIIPTYPSTGSEANGVCDIMEYHGYGVEIFDAWPDYCLMNPETTMSLDPKSTAYSVMVCFIQTSAWYLGNHENDIAKGFSRTVLKTLIDGLKVLQKDPQNLRAKENIMWSSCVDTMGIFRSGIDMGYPWTIFSVGYVPRVAHQVSYREALVPAYIQWLRGISKYHMDDIRQLFSEVLEIPKDLEDEVLVEAGCEMLRNLMEQSQVPLTLSQYGKCPSDEFILQSLEPEDLGEFTPEEMCQMIQGMYQ